MTVTRLAAAAAHFGRDLDFDLHRVAKIIADARVAGAALLVLPDAALGCRPRSSRTTRCWTGWPRWPGT